MNRGPKVTGQNSLQFKLFRSVFTTSLDFQHRILFYSMKIDADLEIVDISFQQVTSSNKSNSQLSLWTIVLSHRLYEC